MRIHDFLLVFSAFISEIAGTLSGFGSSTLFVPLAARLEDFYFVLALTSILHCFGNLAKMILFRKAFQKEIFWKMFLPSVVMTGCGALLVNYLPVEDLKIGLGLVLILVSIVWVSFKKIPFFSSPRAALMLSSLSGFATGLVGTGGAIRGIALSALQIEKSSFVMISSSVDFGGDFLRMLIYLKNGYMDWGQAFYIPLLAIVAYLGAKTGQKILEKMSQKFFETIVAVFVFLSGCLMLVGV
jgi:uncharacterized membrane protein YfcA